MNGLAIDDAWARTSPQHAVSWLGSVAHPWCIAGGWALDLFSGAQSREHGDLDVGIRRRDAVEFISALGSWECFEAKDGALTRLNRGQAPGADVNSIWCRFAHGHAWAMELMLDDVQGEHWQFRRDARIRRPLTTLIRRSPDQIPYLAPEVQLLYKARNTRPKDQTDFEHVAPLMDHEARAWLVTALKMAQPNHPWVSLLES